MKPENIEFIALFEAAGWKQTEAARRLGVTAATISRYISGEFPPGKPLIELFKIILAAEKPGALSASVAKIHEDLADWERRVVEDLRWLHREDRERVLNAMRAFIEGLPRREPVSYKPTADKAVKDVLKEANEEAVDRVVDTRAKPSKLGRPARGRVPRAARRSSSQSSSPDDLKKPGST